MVCFSPERFVVEFNGSSVTPSLEYDIEDLCLFFCKHENLNCVLQTSLCKLLPNKEDLKD